MQRHRSWLPCEEAIIQVTANTSWAEMIDFCGGEATYSLLQRGNHFSFLFSLRWDLFSISFLYRGDNACARLSYERTKTYLFGGEWETAQETIDYVSRVIKIFHLMTSGHTIWVTHITLNQCGERDKNIVNCCLHCRCEGESEWHENHYQRWLVYALSIHGCHYFTGFTWDECNVQHDIK